MMRVLLLLCLLLPGLARAYPLDGLNYTGIARLEGYRLAQGNKASGRVQPPGGQLALYQVDLRRVGSKLALPAPDAEFSRQLAELLGADADRYAVAVLDLSDPAWPVYAEHRAEARFNPGSVGKLVVATALFQQLADLYPDDIAARERILREAQVVADSFIVSDSHAVPFWDGSHLAHRPLRQGDTASLWTYLDWMLSASSNAAASMVMRETLLLAGAGRAYPLDKAQIDAFFRRHSKAELAARLGRALQGGIARNGLDPQALQQGGFFTQTGKTRVPGTGSWATPRELMRWLLALEEGRIVDAWSSREIKRLLYMTQRRIRYASSPALDDAAVYFKSGSLFRCQPEPGFVCRKYQGNVENLLNSVAIVEHPAGKRRLHYMVVINSNVLRVNSAVAHQTLGTRLQRLMEKRHLAARGGVEHGLVHPDDQTAQPLAALGILRQGHRDVAAAVTFDDGAVGMPVLPAAGLAEDLRTRALGLQALDELVVNAGIAEDGLHLAGQLGGNQPTGLQQVVEAGHLQGRRPVRKIVHGVAQGVAALPVGPAHPEAAVALGVVQAVAGRLQQLGQVAHADPLQHLAGGGVRGNADHPDQGVAGGCVELHVAGFDAGEGPEQDGDLGQARGIGHVIGIEGGKAGAVGLGDVDQGHRQASLAYRRGEAERFQPDFKLGLQTIIEGTFERREGLAGVNGYRTQDQGKAEDQSCKKQTLRPPGWLLASDAAPGNPRGRGSNIPIPRKANS
jgi:hypothetical protein